MKIALHHWPWPAADETRRPAFAAETTATVMNGDGAEVGPFRVKRHRVAALCAAKKLRLTDLPEGRHRGAPTRDRRLFGRRLKSGRRSYCRGTVNMGVARPQVARTPATCRTHRKQRWHSGRQGRCFCHS